MKSHRNVRFSVALLLTILVLFPLSDKTACSQTERLFDTSIGFGAGNHPSHLFLTGFALDDLDGDGDQDVIVSRRGGFTQAPIGITILENLGQGFYDQPIHFDVPGSTGTDGFARLAQIDFDNDGDKDIAVSRPGLFGDDGEVALFRKNAGLTFSYFGTVQAGAENPNGIEAADFNGDGNMDLAITSGLFDTDLLSVMLGNGNGGFSATLTKLNAQPSRLESADVDGDGHLDIAIICRNGRLKLLLNNGSGQFPDVQNIVVDNGNFPFFCDVALGDIDNDGDVDIISSHSNDVNFGVLALARNDGVGNFSPWELLTLPRGSCSSSIQLVDISQDGWLDILVASNEGTVNGSWAVSINDGAGNFNFVPEEMRYHSGEAIGGLLATDIDFDGDMDVIAMAGDSMQVNVHLNPGNHDFRPGTFYGADGAHSDLVSGDVDNDGDLDLVSCAHTGAGLINVFLNDGVGNMELAQILNPPAPFAIKLGDINNDGLLDLAWVQNSPPYEAYSSLNLGGGQFGTPQLHLIRCGGPGDSALFDVNGDGNLDQCIVNRLVPFEGLVGINLGNGDGTFQPDDLIQVDVLARGIDAGDINEDGHLDLVVTIFDPGGCCDFVDILLGNGDGTFQPTLSR